MVDVVVNNVMATSITPDFSKYMFKQVVCTVFTHFHRFVEPMTPVPRANITPTVQWSFLMSRANSNVGSVT